MKRTEAMKMVGKPVYATTAVKKRRKGIIWHEGYLDEDIKPKQLVSLTIFGGWVYDALVEKEK